MALEVTPTSTVLTAASDSYRDFLSEFETHIGGSSKWSVKQSTDNGSGSDYGITLTPDDANENFDTNIRYNSTDGNVYVAIDPQGQITDALNPTGTGSSETSPENWRALFSGESFDVDLLVTEWNDAWGWMLKDTNDDHIPRMVQAGRIIEPAYSNDPSIGRTGLAWIGGETKDQNNNLGYDSANYDPANEIKRPGDWGSMYAARDEISDFNSYSNAEIPVPWIVYDDEADNNRRFMGFTKYYYRWHRKGGDNGLEVLDSGSGDGFIFASYDGTGNVPIVPWDPSVTPT